VDWLTATALGASGGAIVEVISLWGNLTAWQKARRDALNSKKRSLPSLTTYMDPLPDTLVALTRFLLGALAGLMFHSQVTGTMAAIAVGASAPALLRQLGTARNIHETVHNEESVDSSSQAPAHPRAGRSTRKSTETTDLATGQQHEVTE
jgi:hypothetical protein